MITLGAHIAAIKTEYEEHLANARKFFDKWVETGDSIYREKELQYTGAAWALLRILKQFGEI